MWSVFFRNCALGCVNMKIHEASAISLISNDDESSGIDFNAISAETFENYLRLEYGVNPDEAIYLVNDHKIIQQFKGNSKFDCGRHCLFLLLMFFLLGNMWSDYTPTKDR